MTPLYPAEETYLSEFKPKFKFIKFIPSQSVDKKHYEFITNKYVAEEEHNGNKHVAPTPPGWTLPPGMTIPPDAFIPYVGTFPPGETLPPDWTLLPGMAHQTLVAHQTPTAHPI
jgi:hypothetical protein